MRVELWKRGCTIAVLLETSGPLNLYVSRQWFRVMNISFSSNALLSCQWFPLVDVSRSQSTEMLVDRSHSTKQTAWRKAQKNWVSKKYIYTYISILKNQLYYPRNNKNNNYLSCLAHREDLRLKWYVQDNNL